MEFLLFLGISILILGVLFLLFLIIILYLMIKGLMKKHPKVDQAEAFIYRIHQTHFRRNHKQNQR